MMCLRVVWRTLHETRVREDRITSTTASWQYSELVSLVYEAEL